MERIGGERWRWREMERDRKIDGEI